MTGGRFALAAAVAFTAVVVAPHVVTLAAAGHENQGGSPEPVLVASKGKDKQDKDKWHEPSRPHHPSSPRSPGSRQDGPRDNPCHDEVRELRHKLEQCRDEVKELRRELEECRHHDLPPCTKRNPCPTRDFRCKPAPGTHCPH